MSPMLGKRIVYSSDHEWRVDRYAVSIVDERDSEPNEMRVIIREDASVLDPVQATFHFRLEDDAFKAADDVARWLKSR